jgi:putative flippase GtrA
MKLKSLSMFFPFYNDEGTVVEVITKAFEIGRKVSEDLEVIAIHGGNSKDKTFNKIKEVQKKFPNLKIVDRTSNTEGYAVIKHGFKHASKDWVFYTDGDAQYDLNELQILVAKYFETNADVVNGYKTSRGDGIVRHVLGDLYAKFSTFIFELPIRDTDCDFRLINNKLMQKIELVSTDSSILGELIKKLELTGAKFAEVPVSHFDRKYGKSNYSPFGLFWEKLTGDLKLYFKLRNIRGADSKFRIIKFGAVGISSIAIQFTLFNLILYFTKVPSYFAAPIADQFAILNSFILNNRFTFKDKKHLGFKSKAKPFLKFYLIVSSTTILQAFILYLGSIFFGAEILISNIFFIIGLAVSFFINYILQKRLVWN